MELSAEEQHARARYLFELMRDVGLTAMRTEELEEWTYLMSKSLEGAGDGPVKEVSTVHVKPHRNIV